MCVFSTDFLRTHVRPSKKVRRNSFQHPFSLKIKAPILITLHDGSGACGGSGGEVSATSAIPPYVVFV